MFVVITLIISVKLGYSTFGFFCSDLLLFFGLLFNAVFGRIIIIVFDDVVVAGINENLEIKTSLFLPLLL